MDKITRKTAFKQWMAPISNELFAEQVQLHCLDHYTKKLHMASFMNLLLYAQLHETESLRAVSDSVFSEELQEATDLGFHQLLTARQAIAPGADGILSRHFSRLGRTDS